MVSSYTRILHVTTYNSRNESVNIASILGILPDSICIKFHNLSVMVELKIMVPSKVLWTLLFVGNGSMFESIKNTKVNSVVIPGAQQKQN